MNTTDEQGVAVVGLGAMGLPIAQNLLRAGYKVYGCDVSTERLALLTAAGGVAVNNAAEIPVECNLYLVLLPDPSITEAVIFGEGGVTDGGIQPGDVLINMGTIGPEALLSMASRLSPTGVRVLDAPMGKSSAAASDGTLSLMVSGDDKTIKECQPVLDCLSSDVIYCGPLGIASTVKIVNNLVSATILDVVAQGLALGAAAGAPVDLMMKVMVTTGADNWHLRNTFAHHVAKRDFEPGASINIVSKDMKIGLDMATRRHIPLPTIAMAHQRYITAQACGYGGLDWGALAKVAERDSGENSEIRGDSSPDLVSESAAGILRWGVWN